MRLVPLNAIKGNEILAKPVVDISGRILLSKGISIKLSYLNKLDEIGISEIYIDDKISEGIEIEDVLCDETRLKTKEIIQKEMQRYIKTKDINVREIQSIVNIIMQEVLVSKTDLINLKDLKLKDEYTFSHSVNVCILSVLLSIKLGLNQKKVHNIGIGCLLHDFGKILIPDKILAKSGKLSVEEFEEIKKHPIYGYEAIKNEIDISPSTKVTVLLHHERTDGSGYPFGYTAEKIHETAKICSICDVFDAMTSDRVYREALSTSDAVEYLYSTAGIYFDKKLVSEFLKLIPIYPAGTIVLLNNGLIGIIIKNNKSNLLRPIVRLLINPKTKMKYNNYIVDLMEDLTLKIDREIKTNINEIM